MAAAPVPPAESSDPNWWVAIGTIGGAAGTWLLNWLGVWGEKSHKRGADSAMVVAHGEALVELRAKVAALESAHYAGAERIAAIPKRDEFEELRRELFAKLDRMSEAIQRTKRE